MRPVMAGQTSGQRVKTKSATQTWPARSASLTVRPERSTSENGGTAPRSGSGRPQASRIEVAQQASARYARAERLSDEPQPRRQEATGARVRASSGADRGTA